MFLNILIAISILLLFVAFVVSIRLVRITKFNAAWILFSVAFLLMLMQLVSEMVWNISGGQQHILGPRVSVWLWILTSLCFTAGLFVINKLITYIMIMQHRRETVQKKILNTIITTEERERRRFSTDLHDGLGPLLSSAKLSISALNTIGDSESQKEILNSAEEVINEAIKSLKEISNNLNPHVLNNFGLASAVKSFLNKLILPRSIELEYNINLAGKRYPSDIEIIIYRAVCELVNNAIKHSRASKIVVELSERSKYIVLSVMDDGVGFENSENVNEPSNGAGLNNIASRVSSIKGVMDLNSVVGEGTVVNIKVKAK